MKWRNNLKTAYANNFAFKGHRGRTVVETINAPQSLKGSGE
jgi:hypothetical protein